jgi:hypothetical protein
MADEPQDAADFEQQADDTTPSADLGALTQVVQEMPGLPHTGFRFPSFACGRCGKAALTIAIVVCWISVFLSPLVIAFTVAEMTHGLQPTRSDWVFIVVLASIACILTAAMNLALAVVFSMVRGLVSTPIGVGVRCATARTHPLGL